MPVDIKVPSFPESVADGTIVRWIKHPGDPVASDETLVEIETDKVVFEVPAPTDGVLTDILEGEGEVVVSGQVIGNIKPGKANATAQQPVASKKPAPAAADVVVTPSAQRLIEEHGLDAAQIEGSGRGNRILKEDVLRHLDEQSAAEPPPAPASAAATAVEQARAEPETTGDGARVEKRVPMTRLRARVAERLLEAQHNAALLTTFNEINMQPVMALRQRYRDTFEKRHGVKLGFMSFFVKAAVEALKRLPEVNASIDGNDIVYHGYFDIGIAVGSPRGLVVPILRDADTLSMAEIEARIADFAQRAKAGTLGLEEITGGTFTITNGGVFGSLLSTPIINPPQSGILGMHKIQERPMAENGEVVIRPMMYVAMSYDHRLIDGREAVQFLVTIKDVLEDPSRLLLEV